MSAMKPQAKLIGFGLVAVIVFFVGRLALNQGWIPAVGILKSMSVGKAQLPDIADAQVADVQPLAYPTTSSNGCGDPIRSEIWAWNSMMGWLYSNGGVDTTKGSLGDKHGVCLHFNRQDDTGQMKADLLACAKGLKSSSECSDGVNFITIMADGSGQFLGQYNAEAKKICADCTAEIVGTTGFSRGEDALWGPEKWKNQPRAALGDGLIAGVLRDGDWNTGMKWMGDNNLKNNPDEHTFDDGAVNWVNAKDYIDAAQKYVAGYCEDRKVIKDGHLTGESRNVCVKGVVTWTPGDTIIAHQKGGIVRIVSTKQYRSQMPSAIIGIKKWDKAHADRIAGMLAAALEGGDQVKAFPEALKRAGDISASVYCQNGACSGNEQSSGAYWVKYYRGVTESDAQGKQVELGGSYADNMNDALTVFGLASGANNNMKATYSIFAKIVDQQYHDMFAKTPIPPYEQAATTSYLLQAKSLLDNAGSVADTQQYSADADSSKVVGDKNWDIEFATGSAMLTDRGIQTVKEIKDQVAITGLIVSLTGYTDNTGNRNSNITLSQARAASVKTALQHMASADFPDGRFRVSGRGPDNPVCNDQSASCLSRNRRVEVVLAE
jgi:OmpA-OmpF porin, OOP family